MSSSRSPKRPLDDVESLPSPKRIHHDEPITSTVATPTDSVDSPSESSGVPSSPASSVSSRSSSIESDGTMLGPMLVKRLSKKARIPTRGSKQAAGFDLYSAKAMTIPAQSQGLVPTDISIAVPEGTYGRVAPRSGLALRHFVDVGAGVVDYDYRGPLGIVLFNFGQKDFVIEEGDRIAQLVLEKVHMCEALEVEELDDTERGTGGFGSTGVKVESTGVKDTKICT